MPQARPDGRHRPLTPLALAAALLVAGCGGGGTGAGGAPDTAGGPRDTPTTMITGVVADGPLQGASVCLDTNDNGRCEAGEPTSAETDRDGRWTLQVPSSGVGRHAVVAMVPATAVDRDDPSRPVGTAFTLRAPPTTETSVFVSPLTTLVAEIAGSRGVPVADAAAEVQWQLGMRASPLADFVRTADLNAAMLARTLNTVTIDVLRMAEAQGVPPEERPALVRTATTTDLQVLAARVQAAAATATGDATARLLAVARDAATAVLVDRNLTTETVRTQADVMRALAAAAPAPAPAPGPTLMLRRFTYTDAANYSYTLHHGDTREANADGEFPFHESVVTVSGGQVRPHNRNMAWWDGTTWRVCERSWRVGLNRNQTATDPGRGTWCGAGRYENRLISRDISGRRMADVVAEIRAFPLRDSDGRLPTNWGPDPTLLGDAVFPSGSELNVRQTRSEIGGNDVIDLTSKPRVRPSWRHVATLEELARMSGPFTEPGDAVSNLNTAWVDDVANDTAPAGPEPLRPLKRFRVGLDPASDAVRFYRCDVRVSDERSVNCEALGDGLRAVTTQGDARVMRITAGYPVELLSRNKAQRTWVERDGVVFNGRTLLENLHHNHRLTATAWTALRDRLGLVTHPTPEPALAQVPAATNLRWFTYTDTGNWFYRLMVRDATQPPGDWVVSTDLRQRAVGGVLQPGASDLEVWDGTRWVSCPKERTSVSLYNPTTRESVYCGGYLSSFVRSTTVTLDGRSVADVVRDVRWYPTPDRTNRFSDWGPDPDVHAARLAGLVFPSGSTMRYHVSTQTQDPPLVNLSDAARVRVPPPPGQESGWTWPVAGTLETMVVAYPGPLAGEAVGMGNTLFAHRLTLAAPPSPEFTAEVEIRLSFDPVGNRATFWQWRRIAATGQWSAPEALLQTTFSIAPLGGYRVLQFAEVPQIVLVNTGGGERRLFVERAGEVRHGAIEHTFPGGIRSIRLNETAWETLRTALGIPAR